MFVGEPKITVGVTAWREGDLLKEAIESLLKQTEGNWRCNLVVDGGADEATLSIARSVEDPRVRTFILRENVGPYGTRAHAIRESETEFFHFLDGDDVLPPRAVEVALAEYERSNADYLCAAVRVISPTGESRIIRPSLPDAKTLIIHKRFPGIATFRKRVWENLGGYALELSRGRADLDFILGLIEGEFRGAVTEHVNYEYRQRVASVSQSYTKSLGQKHEAIVDRHPGVFSDQRLRDTFLSEAYSVSAWACFAVGEYASAAIFARKYRGICGLRTIWPLHLADQIPAPVLRALVIWRRLSGKMKRLLYSRGAPACEGAIESGAECAGRGT